jgi:hypothetical protein
MVRIITRVAIAVVGLAAVYLLAINIVLNLPATQMLFNRSQDGKIILSWDSAWTWLPFRLHVTNLKVNGQSWSQQFEVTIPSASAGIDVPSLFAGILRFNDLETADLDVRFRPRPRPDRDDSALRPFYPEIPGRDPTLAADPVPTQSPGWLLVFDVARIGGSNRLWLAANRMTLNGTAAALIERQNKHGPLTVRDGRVDLTVTALNVAGKDVADNGSLSGTFGFTSFIPQENRGVKILEYATMDADIDLPINGIDFLNTFLDSVADMSVGGRGRLKGHIAYALGSLAPGADIQIDAESLRVDLVPYTVRGAGTVTAKVEASAPEEIVAHLAFSTIAATHGGDDHSLFEGKDIGIDVVRSAVVFPEALTEEVPRSVRLALPNVTVPDVSVYQRYLPDEWKAELIAGKGLLEGLAMMSRSELAIDLTLSSDDAKIRLTDDTFESGLSLVLKANGTADATSARIDVAGTSVELDDSRVTSRSGDQSSPWHARFAISEGYAAFPLPEDQDEKTGVVGFWSLFKKIDLKAMLSSVDGQVRGKLGVSDLDWLTVLFRKPFSLQIADAAEVDADLTVAEGRLTTASSLKMAPTDFTLGILDYVVKGTGGFALAIARSDARPDLSLTASLTGASLRLEDEKTAVVSDVTIAVDALAESVSPKDGGALRSVAMTIPSAKITDLSAYNTYLPKNAPIRILNGTGALSAKLVMQGPDNATGFMKLTSSRVDADIQGDRLSGVIGLDIAIAGGSAQERRFDISGSKLTLSDVQVTGRHATGGWGGSVNIGKGSVVWKRPMTLDMSATLYMKDAQPILAIFQANRKENKWLDRLLDLRNINGRFTLRAEPDSLVIPYAFATSNTFDVGAKGIFGASGRQGVFYARTGKLAGILAIDNTTKKFELIDATGKFESYKPGGPVPGIHDTPRARATAPKGMPPPIPSSRPNKQQPFSLFKRR